MIAVLAVVGLTLGAATAILQPAAAPLETGAVLLEGFFTRARARAMATTSAYRITPADATREVLIFLERQGYLSARDAG